MARQLTTTLQTMLALSLALLSACGDDDKPSEPDGLDGGRDASTADGGRPDGAAPGFDASDANLLDAQLHDAQATDARVDDAQALLASRLAQLTTSRAKWRELAAASPGPYWYADENCVLNGVGGQVSKIQVEPPTSRLYEQVTIARADCQVYTNRYSTRITNGGGTESMDQLYDVCDVQLRRLPASTFSLDARGVIKACFSSTAENCLDTCGSGFYLRDWQFGNATPTPDAGVHPDAGVPTDAGH
jgi:hypothetical protein